jgi:hypothetical protein
MEKVKCWIVPIMSTIARWQIDVERDVHGNGDAWVRAGLK